MPLRWLTIFRFLPLGFLATALPAWSQSYEKVITDHKKEGQRWKLQLEGAQRDVDLAEKTFGDFYTAAKLADPTNVAAINLSLNELRSRFPDRRLKYAEVKDYCRVYRAIESAKSSALGRVIEAAENLQDLGDQGMILSEIGLFATSAKISGRTLTVDIASEAFANSVDRRKENAVRTSWTPADYSEDSEPDECD